MAPRRKPVVNPEAIVKNWHLRPKKGHRRPRKGWADQVAASETVAPQEPPRPWVPPARTFPTLDAIYEQTPAYSVDGPPVKPVL